jgi:RNase adaptor protein for sRNA GlmZ degradation
VKQTARREARQLVILTGLSGSGKSTVLKAFEDMGSTASIIFPSI